MLTEKILGSLSRKFDKIQVSSNNEARKSSLSFLTRFIEDFSCSGEMRGFLKIFINTFGKFRDVDKNLKKLRFFLLRSRLICFLTFVIANKFEKNSTSVTQTPRFLRFTLFISYNGRITRLRFLDDCSADQSDALRSDCGYPVPQGCRQHLAVHHLSDHILGVRVDCICYRCDYAPRSAVPGVHVVVHVRPSSAVP